MQLTNRPLDPCVHHVKLSSMRTSIKNDSRTRPPAMPSNAKLQPQPETATAGNSHIQQQPQPRTATARNSHSQEQPQPRPTTARNSHIHNSRVLRKDFNVHTAAGHVNKARYVSELEAGQCLPFTHASRNPQPLSKRKCGRRPCQGAGGMHMHDTRCTMHMAYHMMQDARCTWHMQLTNRPVDQLID